MISIHVVLALTTRMLWCTYVPFQSFYLPTFFSKKFPYVAKYVDLTSSKEAVTYLHMGDRSLILTWLLYPLETGIDPGGGLLS